MINVREQNEEERLIHGDNFPVTLIIGGTTKYLTVKAFNELKTELNKFAIPDVVSMSKCCNADCQEPTASPDGVYCEFHRSM